MHNKNSNLPAETLSVSKNIEIHEKPKVDNFYSDMDQKIKNHNYEISLPEILTENKGVSDIPESLFKRVDHPLPYQGLVIDRNSNQKLFRHMYRYTTEVKEHKRKQLIQKINSYFPANPLKEKAIVTQCVRTMWDLYF